MNIFTSGIDSKKQLTVKMEAGTGMFQRQSFSYNSGKMKNGFGFTGAFSRKKGDGFVDGTYTDGYFFYAKLEKKFKNHLLSLSAFGAPQSHGQRSFKQPISFFNVEDARGLGVSQSAIDQYSLAGGQNHGIKFNQFYEDYINNNRDLDYDTLSCLRY